MYGKVLLIGGCSGKFSKKLPGASPMPERSKASQLQEGPTTAGQGQAQGQHWDDIFKMEKILYWAEATAAREDKWEYVTETTLQTARSEEGEMEELLQVPEEISLQSVVKTMVQ